METALARGKLADPSMMTDDVVPSDYAIFALCVACATLAYLHSGAKVAATVLAALVVAFALADRLFTWWLVVGLNLALAALLAFEKRGARQPRQG